MHDSNLLRVFFSHSIRTYPYICTWTDCSSFALGSIISTRHCFKKKPHTAKLFFGEALDAAVYDSKI